MTETLTLSTATISHFKAILISLETGFSLIKNHIYLHGNEEFDFKTFFQESESDLDALKKQAKFYPSDQLDYTTQDLFDFFKNLTEKKIPDSEALNTLKDFLKIVSEEISGDFFSDPCILPCKHTLNRQSAQASNQQCPYDRKVFFMTDLNENKALTLIIQKFMSVLRPLKEKIEDNIEILIAYSQLELPLKYIGIISIAEKYELLLLIIQNLQVDLIKKFADYFIFLNKNNYPLLTNEQKDRLLLSTQKAQHEEIAIFVCTKILTLRPMDYTNFFLWALENKFHRFIDAVIPEHYRVPYPYYIQAIIHAARSNFDTQLHRLFSLYNFPEFTTPLLQEFRSIASSIPITHQQSLQEFIIALSTQKIFLQISWKELFTNTLELAALISNPNINETAIKKILDIFLLELRKASPENEVLIVIKKLVKYISDREYFVEKLTQLTKFLPPRLYEKFHKNICNIFTLRMTEIIIIKEPHPRDVLTPKTQLSIFLQGYNRSSGFWTKPKLIEILNTETKDSQLQKFIAEDELFTKSL
jgi:hypothetical protein